MSRNSERLSKKSGTTLKKPARSNERTSIHNHEGKKYLRTIKPAATIAGDKTLGRDPILIDIYSVITAFDVICPATAHAIKKLLCAGTRGKGDAKADLIGAIAAINRAIDLLENQG